MKNVLVFDISGDYGQFKKFFTNMSPLTFDFPPRTVITGIVGAIGGIQKEDNPEFFAKEQCFIALQILKEVKKTKIPQNYLKTVSKVEVYRFKNHKPTNVEFVKDPAFRIFFSHKDIAFNNLFHSLLKEHKAVYTPSLGTAGCLLNYRFIGESEIESVVSTDFQLVSSVVPEDNILDISFDQGGKISRTSMPFEMKNDREVLKYGNVIYEATGRKLKLKLKTCYKIQESAEAICEL